jgi:hypothetical protein
MNNLENENIGLMLHKLTKYETLQAGGAQDKKDFYSQKAKYYRNKLSKIGIDNQNLDNISNVIHGGTFPDLTTIVESQGLQQKLQALADSAAQGNQDIADSVAKARAKLESTAGNYESLLNEFVKTTRQLLNHTSQLAELADAATRAQEESNRGKQGIISALKQIEEMKDKAQFEDAFAQQLVADINQNINNSYHDGNNLTKLCKNQIKALTSSIVIKPVARIILIKILNEKLNINDISIKKAVINYATNHKNWKLYLTNRLRQNLRQSQSGGQYGGSLEEENKQIIKELMLLEKKQLNKQEIEKLVKDTTGDEIKIPDTLKVEEIKVTTQEIEEAKKISVETVSESSESPKKQSKQSEPVQPVESVQSAEEEEEDEGKKTIRGQRLAAVEAVGAVTPGSSTASESMPLPHATATATERNQAGGKKSKKSSKKGSKKSAKKSSKKSSKKSTKKSSKKDRKN